MILSAADVSRAAVTGSQFSRTAELSQRHRRRGKQPGHQTYPADDRRRKDSA